jgi:hypothetical protein
MTDDAMLALAFGRLDEAAVLVEEAFVSGERAIPELAIPARVFQHYLLHDLSGGLDRIEPEMRAIVAEHPARRVFACALAHIHARQGRLGGSAQLDEAEDGFSHLLFDQEWLMAMSLLPRRRRCSTAPTSRGTVRVDRALGAPPRPPRGNAARWRVTSGQLATLPRCWDAAEAHFEESVARNKAWRPPWLALTRADYARMLLARGRRRPGPANALLAWHQACRELLRATADYMTFHVSTNPRRFRQRGGRGSRPRSPVTVRSQPSQRHASTEPSPGQNGSAAVADEGRWHAAVRGSATPRWGGSSRGSS